MRERTYPLNTDEVEWTDPIVSCYPEGVKEKILWENPDTGAITALIKYPAGSGSITHTHPEANETGYVLEGEGEDQDGNRIPMKGIFVFTPKGVEHSGGEGVYGKYSKDTVILLSWDGPR
jgi:quercetin dioxygenase-like cupin family protein